MASSARSTSASTKALSPAASASFEYAATSIFRAEAIACAEVGRVVGRGQLRLVQAEPHHVAGRDDRAVPGSGDPAALGGAAGQGEVFAIHQRGLHERRRPRDLPRVVHARQVGRGLVGPGRAVEVPGPRQRSGRRVVGDLRLGHLDVRRRLLRGRRRRRRTPRARPGSRRKRPSDRPPRARRRAHRGPIPAPHRPRAAGNRRARACPTRARTASRERMRLTLVGPPHR